MTDSIKQALYAQCRYKDKHDAEMAYRDGVDIALKAVQSQPNISEDEAVEIMKKAYLKFAKEGAWVSEIGLGNAYRALLTKLSIKENEWRHIDTAPRDETSFLLRHKKTHVTVEALFYQDQEFLDGHPITEVYYVLQDLYKDEPIDACWDDYEWKPLVHNDNVVEAPTISHDSIKYDVEEIVKEETDPFLDGIMNRNKD